MNRTQIEIQIQYSLSKTQIQMFLTSIPVRILIFWLAYFMVKPLVGDWIVRVVYVISIEDQIPFSKPQGTSTSKVYF